MRYAILGDIHANLEAFEAVLDKLSRERIDRWVCMGDVVGYGASPVECLRKVREMGCAIVAGNHDFAVAGKLNIDFFNTFARQSTLWTREQLTSEEIDFLGSLKLVDVVDGFTVVHATIHSPELFEYIQTSYDAHLSFKVMKTPLAFLGHSHVPVTFVQKRSVSYTLEPELVLEDGVKMMVNVGSIGQPRDENWHAAYAIYDSDERRIEVRRTPYDVDKSARKIVDAGLPEILAERLRYGR